MFLKQAVLLSLLLLSLSHQAMAFSDGHYQIQGTHSVHGSYSGDGWIYQGQAQRVIQFHNLKYQERKHQGPKALLNVQSVWSGTADTTGLRFGLSLSNTLTSFDGFTPSKEVLNTVVTVKSESLGSSKFSFRIQGEGVATESWLYQRPASSQGLWKNLRTQEEGTSVGDPIIAIQTARWLGIDTVIDWYRSQPETLPYRHRPEYKEQKQYFIVDKTDADFYLKNPQTLRIANKTLNPLAFAEALMRRNAYARTLAKKAELLAEETFRDNLNSAGMLEVVYFKEGKKIRRMPEYDAALWSAMLGFAEYHRFKVTQDPSAIANFKKVLEGVLLLLEITQDPKTFARTVAISPPDENLGEGWVQGKGRFASLKWRQGANNDMAKSFLLMMTLAHQVLSPEDVDLRARVRLAASQLSKLEVSEGRNANGAMAKGLAALWSQDPEQLRLFLKGVRNFKTVVSDAFGLQSGIYLGGIADWSGIHLSTISNLIQIHLAEELQTAFPAQSQKDLQKVREEAEVRLLEMQNNYRPAHRHFLTLLTYQYSGKARASTSYLAEAREALWTLKEVPVPRSFGAAKVHLPDREDWSMSAWPRVPWKVLKGPRKMEEGVQFRRLDSGVYGYPHFEVMAWFTTYLWKDTPFKVSVTSDPTQQVFSADYLLIYWSARASGLLSAQD